MNIKTVIVLLTVWIIIYSILNKYEKVKSKIKLYLRKNFNDYEEKKWARLVSSWYDFFPLVILIFLDKYQLKEVFSIKVNILHLLLLGVMGFFASITLTTIVLDLFHYLFGYEYSAMNEVRWMKQVRKIGLIFGIMAALSEEFFIRYLIPKLLYIENKDTNFFIIALSVTSLIFIVLQMFYVESDRARFVKAIAGISISVVSIMLIIATDSVIPSMIMHGSYAYLFLNKNRENSK